METITPSICFPARTQCLELIRSFCREILDSHRCEPDLHRKLVLAIDEAVANVIEHAYSTQGEDADSSIELSIDVQADRVVTRILDRGRAFDPRGAEQEPPVLLERLRSPKSDAGEKADSPRRKPRFPTRGFGLHLIRLIMDDIEYERTPQGENILQLTKRLRKG